MQQYFADPSDPTADDFLKLVALLNDKVQAHVNPDSPRMTNGITARFAELLEDENLPPDVGTVDEVYTSLAQFVQGMMRWNHPGAMINVTPPPSVPSTAAAGFMALLNPNGAQDMSSGHLLLTELSVARMLAQLAGIDPRASGGVFTFGGKATNLHAVKHGIQRVDPEATARGISDDIVVVTSTQGHPCHEEVCGWLGLGEDNCLRVPAGADGVVDMAALESALDDAFERRLRVATIFANGGTTIQMAIDPIREIVELRDKMVERHGLSYIPRVHVDSVIGWVFLFFRTYDFDANPLGFGSSTLDKLNRQQRRISEVVLADSFGVDFHKTGFCSYSSSIYISADRYEIFQQGGLQDPDHPIGGGGKLATPYEEVGFGNHSPFQYTLELSRSLNGSIEAYVNLKLFGVKGYQRLIGGLFDATETFKTHLFKSGRFEVLNDEDSDSMVTLFVAHEDSSWKSFFDLGAGPKDPVRRLAEYNYGFYLYLMEQQALGRCRSTPDYSSGYHVLENGSKMGVHKAYPVSPFFTHEEAIEISDQLLDLLEEYDQVKDGFEPSVVPHTPRPLIWR